MKLYIILIGAFLFITTGMFSAACQFDAKTSAKKDATASNTPPDANGGTNNQNMSQENLTAAPESDWGANGVGVQVKEDVVNIQYPCADGEIPGKLMINSDGAFSVDGYHKVIRGGPRHIESPPPRQPAHYEGKISGDTMTLKVWLKETGEQIADFTLKKDKQPVIRRCQ